MQVHSESIDSERLICTICLQQIQDPRLLDCLHSFCVDCLICLHSTSQQQQYHSIQESISNQNELGTFLKCPECRHVSCLSDEQAIQHLPVDLIKNQLLNEFNQSEHDLKQSSKSTQLHEINQNDSEKVIQLMRQLETLVNQSRPIYNKFQSYISVIVDTMRRIELKSTQIQTQIDEYFQELIFKLNQQRTQLKCDLQTEINHRIKLLSLNLDDLIDHLALIDQAKEHIHQLNRFVPFSTQFNSNSNSQSNSVKSSKDYQMISVDDFQAVTNCLKRRLTHLTSLNTMNLISSDEHLKFNPNSQEFDQSIKSLANLIDTTKEHVCELSSFVQYPTQLYFKQPNSIVVQARTRTGEPYLKGSIQVRCEVKFCDDKSENLINFQLEPCIDQPDTYQSHFIPVSYGLHSIRVFMNEIELSNSPCQLESITKKIDYRSIRFTSELIGRFGSNAMEFNHPYDVRFDFVTNQLLVADLDNSRMQIFRRSKNKLKFVQMFEWNSSDDNQIRSPMKVCIDSQGNFIILSVLHDSHFTSNQLENNQSLSSDQLTSDQLSSCDYLPTQNQSITLHQQQQQQQRAFAMLTDEQLALVQQYLSPAFIIHKPNEQPNEQQQQQPTNSIQRGFKETTQICFYSQTGQMKRMIVAKDKDECYRDLFVDKHDNLLVIDRDHRVCVLSSDGQHQRFIGKRSKKKEQRIVCAVSIAVNHNDEILIADAILQRIFMFTYDGQYIRKFAAEILRLDDGIEGSHYPRMISVSLNIDAYNRCIVTDTDRHRLLFFEHDGSFISSIGMYGDLPGYFNFPRASCVDGDGKVIVADCCNNRIQILDFQ